MWILIIILKVILAFTFVMALTTLLTLAERKQSAWMQDRIGPNRAEILGFTLGGLFHPIADAIKLITKEDFVPEEGNSFIHTLAPFFMMVPVLAMISAFPFASGDFYISNIDIGILFVLAMASMTVYGAVLAGYGSNNKFAILGSLRAASQMLSYELVMGLSVIGIILCMGTLNPVEMAQYQQHMILGFIPRWGVLIQPVGFILFLTAAIAENKRTPFDLPEGESEIIGYFIEYSGIRWGMFFIGEFAEIVIISMLITTLFFGAYNIPFLYNDGFHFGNTIFILPHWLVIILQILSFIFKVIFFSAFQLLIRWTLPRFRFDQILRLCWKYLFPIAVSNLIVTAFVVTLINS